MKDTKVSLSTGLVALSIAIPSSMLFTFSVFRPLPFILGIATFSLLVYVLIESYYALEKQVQATTTQPKFAKLLGQVHLGSKIVNGISLLPVAFLFVINFILGLFSYTYAVDYKLFLPFVVLTFIGGFFLRDPDAAAWLDEKIKWLTPYVKAYWQKCQDFLERSKPWVLKHKSLLAAGLVLIFLAITLSMVLSPIDSGPKELSIVERPDHPNKIKRDYDQHLTVRVLNAGMETRMIFLEAEQEKGGDTLILGFAGDGSNFEKIQAAEIKPQSPKDFVLVTHAPNATQTEYSVKLKLFRYDKDNGADSVELVDTRTIIVQVQSRRIELSYEMLAEDSTSLGRTMMITNKGDTISDFSLIPDSALQRKIRIIPEIRNMIFEEGRSITVLVEPVLTMGFTSLEGDLLLAGGGAASPTKLPLTFNAPEGKKLFLAVANCGSINHTHIHECINRRRNRAEMSSPPAWNGPEPHDVNSGSGPDSFAPTINEPEGTPADTVENDEIPKYDSAKTEEIATELDRRRLYDGTTAPQVIARARDLQRRFEALLEEFDASNAKDLIHRMVDNIKRIPGMVRDDASLTPALIAEINGMLERAIKNYDLLNTEAVWNSRREVFIAALGQGEHAGPVNLRMDSAWLERNNGAAPAMFIAKTATHFAWHRSHTLNDAVQSIHYSAHHADGTVLHSPIQMNGENEVGRWPSVVAGENGEVYFAWQGGNQGEKHEINLRASKDGGETWGETKRITNHGTGTYSPRMVLKNNRLFLMWTDFRNGMAQLMLSYSGDKGTTFSQPAIISSMVKPNGVAKFDVGRDYIHFLYEKTVAATARIIYKAIPVTRPDDTEQFQEVNFFEGTYPAIMEDASGDLHFAFAMGDGNDSEIYYTTIRSGTSTTAALERVTNDDTYSISPSISATGNHVRILFHGGIEASTKFIDHLYQAKKDKGTDHWPSALRLPSLTANGKRIFLSAKFKLPWDRRIYNRHNVKVFFNGKLLGKINDNIPEGNILFPVDPTIVYADDFKNKKNVVTLETEHFNPAHYLATSEFALISDLSYIEQFVFAKDQQAADKYLAAKTMFNHHDPDLGLYADENMRIPLQPAAGEEIKVKLQLWNLGQGACTNSTIDIYGGPANLSEGSFQDRYILAQQRLGSIPPMEKRMLNLSFTYWPGLEKVFIRVRTKEKDFDMSNNVHVLTFAGTNGNPYDDTGTSDGVLRVAIFDQPGELAGKADVEVYESGALQPCRTAKKNPEVWPLDPGKYDVRIKKTGTNEIEQWIRGVDVWNSSRMKGMSHFENTVSLDILMQKVSLGDLDTVRVGNNTLKFTLPSSILFHSGQFQINTYAAESLKKIKTLLSLYPDSRLTIEGHTDRVGNITSNQRLSENRADAVKQWLVSIEGIQADRLTTVGYGDSVPVADNNTEEGRAKNRRVAFILNKGNNN